MKNLYDISKAQLLTLWVFAIAFALYSDDTYNELLGAISVLIVFAVIFYTFGWRDEQKKNNLS